MPWGARLEQPPTFTRHFRRNFDIFAASNDGSFWKSDSRFVRFRLLFDFDRPEHMCSTASHRQPRKFRTMAASLSPDDLLTRQAGAKALTDEGYRTSGSTLATMVSRGGGPRYQLYSGRAIYRWSELLAWAESRVTEPRCNSSEADARRVEQAPGTVASVDARTKHRPA